MPSPKWKIEIRHWRPPAISDVEVRGQLKKRLEDIGEKTVEAFKKRAPRRSDNLRNNIEYKQRGGEGVGINILMPWYGKITIQGYAQTRYPKSSKVMRFASKGGLYFRRELGPIPPNPWHLRAKQEAAAAIRAAAREAASDMAGLLKRRLM